MGDEEERPVVVERLPTAAGELVLRRAGRHFEVILDGSFLMDTRDGRSERALVREAVAGLERARVLIAGLGVGFSLDEALAAAEVAAVVVVEVQEAIVRWARSHLRAVAGRGLEDPRVELVVADLAAHLRASERRYDAICLDVDNGPGWLSRPTNAGLYDAAGLALLARRLEPGGRLAVWSSAPSAAFEARLGERFADVRRLELPARRGSDDVVYVAAAAHGP
jgi:spermidine synthase